MKAECEEALRFEPLKGAKEYRGAWNPPLQGGPTPLRGKPCNSTVSVIRVD